MTTVYLVKVAGKVSEEISYEKVIMATTNLSNAHKVAGNMLARSFVDIISINPVHSPIGFVDNLTDSQLHHFVENITEDFLLQS